MKFLSIFRTQERDTPPSEEERCNMGKLVEEGFKSGYLLAVEGCMPSATGARIRIVDGTVTVKDGPFTESKEVVGGFALIQAESKEDAIQFTHKFLHAVGSGECELRQIYEAPAASGAGSPN
jgi:hypothetical protein